MELDGARWATALRRTRAVERDSPLLRARPLPRRFRHSRLSAWASDEGLAALPAGSAVADEARGSRWARVGAESLVVGKFDVKDEVRLRAFYPSMGLTMRYQAGGPRSGVGRIVRANEAVQAHAPGLMPRVLHHGSIRAGAGEYLVEEVVAGVPVLRSQLQRLVEPIAARLHLVHLGMGITSRPLMDVVSSYMPSRWATFSRSHAVSAALGRAVSGLIERNDEVELSFIHGDLVGSNILITDAASEAFVIVDWEFFQEWPIAFDLSKIHFGCQDMARAAKALDRGLRHSVGHAAGQYSFREQLALGHVETLSKHANMLAESERAGRTGALRAGVERRLEALAQLLGPS